MSRGAAPTVERRLDAPGRAIHLFGIGTPDLAGRRFTVDGRRAIALAFGRLSLLVHYVDAQEWGADSIERKRADPAWLETQARLHERMLERAMPQGTVVPAGLLSIFPDLAALEAMARENYTRWRRSLTRVAGKREWCVSVFRGPHAVPKPRPYVLRVAPRDGSRARAPELKSGGGGGDDAQLAEHLQRLWKSCGAVASAGRQIEPLPDRRYVFGAAFLLPQSALEAFRDVIGRLAEVGKPMGLAYYLEGPRPPFTFA